MDVSRQSPLLYATAHGHTECVQLLLESGADPNLANERVPPLHAAAFEGRCVVMFHQHMFSLEVRGDSDFNGERKKRVKEFIS